MRKAIFAEGEMYHIYNRGTDKRTIFLDEEDFNRFLQSMVEFNVSDPIGSLYQNSFRKDLQLRSETPKLNEEKRKDDRLVEIITYCLNPNHFHLILKQISDRGIPRFMQKVGTGYTNYFNHKYDRTGALFQGVFKAVYVDTNEYLLHVSAYVNLNFRVHKLRGETPKYRSSWEEYMGSMKNARGMCCTDPVLGQFRSKQGYKEFAENSLRGTLERRGLLDEGLLLE